MAYLGREAAKAPLVTADIPDDSITSAKIVDATIAAGDLAANSVDSSELVDGSVDLSHMSADSVDSNQYVDASIDLAHMSADSVDSNQYVDGSIDTIHVGDNQITLAKMAHGADGSLITYSASTVPELVAPGTTGHVLTSRGDASTPTFQAAGGGGIVLQIKSHQAIAGQGASTSAYYTPDSTGLGFDSALGASSNPVLVIFSTSIVKYDSNLGSKVDAFMNGGSFGVGASGLPMLNGELFNKIQYGRSNVTFQALDTNPGTTTPLYYFYWVPADSMNLVTEPTQGMTLIEFQG